jgi:hypothetical protein
MYPLAAVRAAFSPVYYIISVWQESKPQAGAGIGPVVCGDREEPVVGYNTERAHMLF